MKLLRLAEEKPLPLPTLYTSPAGAPFRTPSPLLAPSFSSPSSGVWCVVVLPHTNILFALTPISPQAISLAGTASPRLHIKRLDGSEQDASPRTD